MIASIRRWLGRASPPPPAGIGDDCALLPAGSRLITVDPVVFGRHFDASVPPAQVGAKLLKRNLSDIAAMGGVPTAAVIGLMLSPSVRLSWLEQFYRGLAKTARQYGVAIVGGDISSSSGSVGNGSSAGDAGPSASGGSTSAGNSENSAPSSNSGGGSPLQPQDRQPTAAATFAAHLTLLGNPSGRRVLTRSGASVGDYLYVTGILGGSFASGHHYTFIPRLAEGAWLAGRREVTAMMDLSDGLAKDVHALEPRGGASSLFAAALPLRGEVTPQAALTDGEDYELLFAVNPAADLWRFETAFSRRFPRVPLTRIGQLTPRGKPAPGAIDLKGLRGYEHLR